MEPPHFSFYHNCTITFLQYLNMRQRSNTTGMFFTWVKCFLPLQATNPITIFQLANQFVYQSSSKLLMLLIIKILTKLQMQSNNHPPPTFFYILHFITFIPNIISQLSLSFIALNFFLSLLCLFQFCLASADYQLTICVGTVHGFSQNPFQAFGSSMYDFSLFSCVSIMSPILLPLPLHFDLPARTLHQARRNSHLNIELYHFYPAQNLAQFFQFPFLYYHITLISWVSSNAIPPFFPPSLFLPSLPCGTDLFIPHHQDIIRIIFLASLQFHNYH